MMRFAAPRNRNRTPNHSRLDGNRAELGSSDPCGRECILSRVGRFGAVLGDDGRVARIRGSLAATEKSGRLATPDGASPGGGNHPNYLCVAAKIEKNRGIQ